MIERLYVNNFRCLENFTLDLRDKRSALLIGKNGAGKSTVLLALRVLQRIARGSHRVRDIISQSDFTQNDKKRPMRFEIDIFLSETRYTYSVALEWPENFVEARIADEGLKCDGQPVFSRRTQSQSEVILGTSKVGFALDWHVFALPVVNERPPHDKLKRVREFLSQLILLAPAPADMSGFSEEPAAELDPKGINYAACLRTMLQQTPSAYAAFDAFVKQVMPDFSSIQNIDRGKDGASQMVVHFQPPAHTKPLDLHFDVLSNGEKCFFLAAYIVAMQAAGKPVVCAWDEPDNHLSLSEVGQFILALRRMAERGGQLIITTHHPEAIHKFADDTTFVLTRRSHLEPTVVKSLSAYSYKGDLIQALIREEIIG